MAAEIQLLHSPWAPAVLIATLMRTHAARDGDVMLAHNMPTDTHMGTTVQQMQTPAHHAGQGHTRACVARALAQGGTTIMQLSKER